MIIMRILTINKVYGSFACDFQTKDKRHVIVTAFTANHWLALQKATGFEDYFQVFEFENNIDLRREENRFAHHDEIVSVLKPWFKNKNLAEISIALDASGACWGSYQTFQQGIKQDPDLSVENPLFENIDQPGIGSYRAAGSFINFTGIQRQPVSPAPILGQDTDEILANHLGLSDTQIGRLHDKGLVSGPVSEKQ